MASPVYSALSSSAASSPTQIGCPGSPSPTQVGDEDDSVEQPPGAFFGDQRMAVHWVSILQHIRKWEETLTVLDYLERLLAHHGLHWRHTFLLGQPTGLWVRAGVNGKMGGMLAQSTNLTGCERVVLNAAQANAAQRTREEMVRSFQPVALKSRVVAARGDGEDAYVVVTLSMTAPVVLGRYHDRQSFSTTPLRMYQAPPPVSSAPLGALYHCLQGLDRSLRQEYDAAIMVLVDIAGHRRAPLPTGDDDGFFDEDFFEGYAGALEDEARTWGRFVATFKPLLLVLNGNVLPRMLVLLRCLETRESWHLRCKGSQGDSEGHVQYLESCVAIASADKRLCGMPAPLANEFCLWQMPDHFGHHECAYGFHTWLADEKLSAANAKRQREADIEASVKRHRAGGAGSSSGWHRSSP